MNAAALSLEALGDLDREALANLWQCKLPKVPMPNLKLRPLRRALAYEIQVKKSGDIDRASVAV